MNETCTKCGGYTGNFAYAGTAPPICNCKEQMESRLSKVESRLDDLYSVLRQGQRIEIDKKHGV